MQSNAAMKPVWHVEEAANNFETILGAKIGWRDAGGDKGRGVFALRDIKKGEIIEVAPVIPVSKAAVPDDGSAPDGYLLDWDEDDEDEAHCMPLGYIMLYNHSKNANMALEADMEDYTMTAKAIRDIKKGEELTWNYSCDLWFDEE